MKLTSVITGASSGIGASLAMELAKRGGNVVISARREAELMAVAERIGSNALAIVGDSTQHEDHIRLRDAALERFGQIDVWVNNVGRGITKRVIDLTDEDLDEMVNVNLRSAIYGMQAIVPYFQERGAGHIINVSSVLGRAPYVVTRSAYSAMKAALNSLTTNLRMELAQTHPGIAVSLVNPGMVFTDFQKNALHGTPSFTPPANAPRPQSAEEVAVVIADLIENPKPEIYTNPAAAGMVREFLDQCGAI